MSTLSEKDLEDASEYDVSSKMHIDDCIDASLWEKNTSVAEQITAAKVREITELRVGSVIIDDAHNTHVKLLAYAGPPPHEVVAPGVNNFSKYIPWVRQVALGIRTLFPGLKQKQVYEKTMLYADWCRQQRRK